MAGRALTAQLGDLGSLACQCLYLSLCIITCLTLFQNIDLHSLLLLYRNLSFLHKHIFVVDLAFAMATQTATLAPKAPAYTHIRVLGGLRPNNRQGVQTPSYAPAPHTRRPHSYANTYHERIVGTHIYSSSDSFSTDDSDSDDFGTELLPDYTSSPSPPPYSKLPPLSLGLVAGWKATAPRSLLLRTAGPADFAVTFPSGRACLLAQRTASKAFAIRAPTIATPALTLAPVADRPSSFCACTADGLAVLRISWTPHAAEVAFTDVLGAGGPVVLAARETRAGCGSFSLRSGEREVALLKHGVAGLHCNVEEGMDGLVVVLVGISLLMGTGVIEGLKGRVKSGLLRGAAR